MWWRWAKLPYLETTKRNGEEEMSTRDNNTWRPNTFRSSWHRVCPAKPVLTVPCTHQSMYHMQGCVLSQLWLNNQPVNVETATMSSRDALNVSSLSQAIADLTADFFNKDNKMKVDTLLGQLKPSRIPTSPTNLLIPSDLISSTRTTLAWSMWRTSSSDWTFPRPQKSLTLHRDPDYYQPE